jgi:MOSC domain-containing protein YiiM
VKPEACVAAVTAAKKHRFSKEIRASIALTAGLGVDGDAHSGAYVRHLYDMARDPTRPNLRQVHLIETELFDELKSLGFDVGPGQLGENITTRHLDLLQLRPGTILRLGEDVLIKITGLREPCLKIDRFQKGLKRAVTETRNGRTFLKRGVMGVVVAGGTVAAGATIQIEEQGIPGAALELV